jgi:carbamoyltransferase
MYILGVFNAHNSGVTLLKDSQIIYASAEERFTREKFTRTFPEESIKNCLEFCGIKYDDIDIIAYGGYTKPPLEAIESYFNTANQEFGIQKAAERLATTLSIDYNISSEFHLNIKKLFPNARIEYVDHHYAHACCAYYISKFNDSFVITADGRGDCQSLVVWKSEKNQLKRVKTYCEIQSLGFLYGQITHILGFTAHRHEGKVTGLAAYGKKTNLIDSLLNMINFDNGEIVVSNDFFPYNKPNNTSHLTKICSGYSREDIAYAVQFVLEKIMLDIVDYFVPKGSNLCLSGGVFANVKLNQRIREQCSLDNYFVFPEMGDGGISFGSAISVALRHGTKTFSCKNMYLGPSYDWNNVDLSKYKVDEFSNEPKSIARIVELLLKNQIIGLFFGRMEYGPRALGARSIIMQATNPEINKTVNKRLNRTEFMPFAPFTLKEAANDMFMDYEKNDINLKYMTTCYNCSDKMKKISPGVVHVDGTARPQLIDSDIEIDLYYKILKEYFNKTGIPNLVNTSFNNHEEPIVCSPIDALESLEKNNIDYLVNDVGMIISKTST